MDHHLYPGRLIYGHHVDLVHDLTLVPLFGALDVLQFAFELQLFDVERLVDLLGLLDLLGALQLLDLVQMLDGAQVVHYTLGVLGHGLDVVRPREPAVALVHRHLVDQLLLLRPHLVGQQRVARVALAQVFQLRLATHHVLQLLFGVKLGVIEGVDSLHQLHLFVKHLVVRVLNGVGKLSLLDVLESSHAPFSVGCVRIFVFFVK